MIFYLCTGELVREYSFGKGEGIILVMEKIWE